MKLLAALSRFATLVILVAWPLAAPAQIMSCGTLGWIMAVAEAAKRDPRQDRGAQSRLRDLSHRYALSDVSAALQASLSDTDLRTVTGFLANVRARSQTDPYMPDSHLRWSASRTSMIVSRASCAAGGTEMRRSTGPQTRDGGANSDDGRIYERRESESFLTRETVERIAIGISVVAAIAALIWAFRFTAILARRHKRHTCGIGCKLVGMGDRILTARMIDLSEGGCKIAVSEPEFKTADSLSLRVGGLDVSSLVIWASGDAIGLTFEDGLAPEQVRDLLARAKAERRAQRRRRRQVKLSDA